MRSDHRPDAAEHAKLTAQLSAAGFLSPDEEAGLLIAAAGGDAALLERMVARRLSGEPLAWITGGVRFCDVEIRVQPGVYMPRPWTEALAVVAAQRLRPRGLAIDCCTGCGAIARVLSLRHPRARIVATDIDARAVACARVNGVEALHSDLFDAVPDAFRGATDVVVAVVPYVPTSELHHLQRDTLTFESTLAYDGGHEGTDVLLRVVSETTRFLRGGGTLLLEVGGAQDTLLAGPLAAAGFRHVSRIVDEDGDLRGLDARYGGVPRNQKERTTHA